MDANAAVLTRPQYVEHPVRKSAFSSAKSCIEQKQDEAPCMAFGQTVHVGRGKYDWEHSIQAFPLPTISNGHDNDRPTDSMTTLPTLYTAGCRPDQLFPRGFTMMPFPLRLVAPQYGIFAVSGETLRV
jgi:hypothetical protein